MNCETARNRLLAQPEPASVPDPVAGHLDVCPACQTWQQLLVRVEEGIIVTAPLAVGGRAKQQLIAQFREAVPQPASNATAKSKPLRVPPNPVSSIQPAQAAAQRHSLGDRLASLWPGGLVAAALLAGVLVWVSLRGNKPDVPTVANLPPDPFLEKVVAAKVKLDTAPGRTDRIAVLDALGSDIHDEARTLSKLTPGAEMDALGRMYEQVVADALVRQAADLTPDEQRAALPRYVNRLVEAEQQANLAAAEAPPDSVPQLKAIAAAAGKGRTELARMMQGPASLAGGAREPGTKAPPLAPHRAELFKRNRPVIERLVDQTVEASRTPNDHLKRASSYYQLLFKFNTEIAEANGARDTARVAELTGHLETLLDRGLAPTLIKARKQVEDGTGNEDYRKVKEDLLAQVHALLGILGDNPAVKASLEEARLKLDEINGPKKK